jgi:hypothetical protein
MPRKSPEPEDVFLAHIKSLIRNLLIDNVNYTNSYYWSSGSFDSHKFITDTKKRAEYILEQIDETDHLVKPFPPEEGVQ